MVPTYNWWPGPPCRVLNGFTGQGRVLDLEAGQRFPGYTALYWLDCCRSQLWWWCMKTGMNTQFLRHRSDHFFGNGAEADPPVPCQHLVARDVLPVMGTVGYNVAWATGANPGSGAGWNIGNIPEAFDLSETLDEAGLRINVIQSYVWKGSWHEISPLIGL